MDTYQAITNWGFFLCLAGGLAYYYYPKQKQSPKPAPPVKEQRKEKEAKRPARKPDQEKKSYAQITAEEPSISDATSKTVSQNGNKKRKADKQPIRAAAPFAAPAPEPEEDEIDMSTRQFALNMQKARDGIQVKSAGKEQARVRSVKPKNSAATNQVLSSGSSQADAEEDWSPAVSPALQAGGIEDMLEPAAAGPSSIRILASEKPQQEKAKKQAKKEVVETKKQRQNRKKAEQKRLEQEEHNQEWKQRQEQQRRGAREARGEPARNGIPVAPAPANNPWSERNAQRDTQLPATTTDGNNAQLLDTFETESNSSSNHGASTAATSTTDAAPSRWADDEVAKAIEESERESGWSEVKSSKKPKKKASEGETNGDATPVAAPAPVSKPSKPAAKPTNKPASRPVGFQALNDELGATADNDELSGWTA